VEQVDRFFKEKYQLEVTTHNLVGAKNAVVAFVESKGEPHFHTSVIVPVDLENQQVTSDVWAYEGKVEGAIMTGLYEMAYEKEYERLDEFTKSIAEKYPVIGMREEAVNFIDTGYSKPYYYTSSMHVWFPEAYYTFMKNHQISRKQLQAAIEKKPFDANSFDIALTFYMKEKQTAPDKGIVDPIITELKKTKCLPPGSYGVYVNTNEIRTTTGIAKDDVGTIPSKNEIIMTPNR
jgi:hypothetical protein